MSETKVDRDIGAMTYPYQGEYAESLIAEGMAKGEARGRALGMAEYVLKVLDMREIAVSEEVRERVMGCCDAEIQQAWFDRALKADSAEELFL